MKELTADDFTDRVTCDLVAQHMLGEPSPHVDMFRAANLCMQRDHRGRSVLLRTEDAQRGLVALVRYKALATEDGRRFTLPPAEPVAAAVVDDQRQGAA